MVTASRKPLPKAASTEPKYFSARTAPAYPLRAVHFSDRLALGPVGFFATAAFLARAQAPKPRLSSIVCLTAQSCLLASNEEDRCRMELRFAARHPQMQGLSRSAAAP